VTLNTLPEDSDGNMKEE